MINPRFHFFSSLAMLLMGISSCSGPATEVSEKNIVETIARQYDLCEDVEALKTVLEKELEPLRRIDSLSTALITRVFVAQKTAEQQDALNAVSSRLFTKAQLAAKQSARADLQLWVAVHYGFYLYTYRQMEEALGLFTYCIHSLEELKGERLIQACDTYKKIAYFLMTAGEWEQANAYLLKAQRVAASNSSELAGITDALGINSLHRNKLAEAERYFKQTLSIATAANDTLRYVKALGNLADIRFRQKQYAEAVDLLNRDIALSQKLDTQNTIYAQVLLGRLHKARGDDIAACQTLLAAQSLARSKPYLKKSDYEISTLMVALAQHSGNQQEELKARRHMDTLQKDLAALDGIEVIARMGWKMEQEKLQLRIEAEKAKKEKEALLKLITLIICFVLLGLIALVIRAYQKKIRLKKSQYEATMHRLLLDKEASEKRLKANSQSLQNYKIYLEEKNRHIMELEAEMVKIKASSTASSEKYRDRIQVLLQSHLLNNDTWTEFKDAFIREHALYYQNLVNHFGHLSDANLRVVFLSKLGMNNPEIARVLGLTLEAIKKSKQRLKKKYGDRYPVLFEEGLEA
ncbi:MAG: hypothetical protein ACTHMM_13545 [Agriterribacter sp.]